jgi:hypothetical protein
MARIERPISPWRKAATAVSRAGQIAACARTFDNWRDLTWVYAGAEMPVQFVGRGRRGFALPMRHPTWA